jgi:hypothetical protein
VSSLLVRKKRIHFRYGLGYSAIAMPHPRSPMNRKDVVSASEIASFVYCPEQWRLQCALGNKSENVECLERGKSFHRGTAGLDVWSRWLVRSGLLLVALALVAALVATHLAGWRR